VIVIKIYSDELLQDLSQD